VFGNKLDLIKQVFRFSYPYLSAKRVYGLWFMVYSLTFQVPVLFKRVLIPLIFDQSR